MNIRWRNLQTEVCYCSMIAVSVYRVLVWQAMDSAIAHLGEVCQATLRQSLYANWTVVVSFFFHLTCFRFPSSWLWPTPLRLFLEILHWCPTKIQTQRLSQLSFRHTIVSAHGFGSSDWRHVVTALKQLYVTIDCRQLIVMIVHHMYIIVYTVSYDSIL